MEKVRDLSAEEQNKAGMGHTESTAPGGRTLAFVRSVLRKGLRGEELNGTASHRRIEGNEFQVENSKDKGPEVEAYPEC